MDTVHELLGICAIPSGSRVYTVGGKIPSPN